MANRTSSIDDWDLRLYHVAIMGSINFCGLVLTTLTLILTFVIDLKSASVRLMLANLILACLLHTFMFFVPQNLFVLYRESLPEIGCSWLGIVFFVLALQMIVFPPFLAINRYIGLYDGEKYKRLFTQRRTVLMIALSWLFAIVVACTFRLGDRSGYDSDNSHCCIVVKDSFKWTIYYCFVILLPTICLCDGTMVYCNWKIYRKLRAHSTSMADSLSTNVVSENKQIFYFLVAETLIPLCFHTIYHLAKVIYVDRENVSMIIFMPAFYSTSAVARCVSTLIFVRPYQRALKSMFVGRWCCGGRREKKVTAAVRGEKIQISESIELLGSSSKGV